MLENALITRVYHHSDHSFSFMDLNSTNSNENIMVVSLGAIRAKDPSINALLSISEGKVAKRESIKDEWRITEIKEEDD